MRRLTDIFASLMLFCTGCMEVNLPQVDQQLVVEGWAEAGSAPIVIVTTTVPVNEEYQDFDNLREHIVRWANVRISDGEKETVLSGRVDRGHFPAYVYSKDTYRVREGQTYSIKVEYGGQTASSTVTVPERKPLEYIRVEKVNENEDSFRIVAGLKDNPHTRDRYKFFVKREKKDSAYLSSFLGYIDDQALSDDVEDIAVYRGMGIAAESFEQYFNADDIVYVKFCRLDDVTWQYWSDYEEITSLSRNPFFPVSSKIRSNVKGGLGYWSGYGASYYKVSIRDSLALGTVR